MENYTGKAFIYDICEEYGITLEECENSAHFNAALNSLNVAIHNMITDHNERERMKSISTLAEELSIYLYDLGSDETPEELFESCKKDMIENHGGIVLEMLFNHFDNSDPGSDLFIEVAKFIHAVRSLCR